MGLVQSVRVPRAVLVTLVALLVVLSAWTCVSQVGPLVAPKSTPAAAPTAIAVQPTVPPPTATPVPFQQTTIELGARFGLGSQVTRRYVDVPMQPNQRLEGSFIIVKGKDVEFGVLDPFGVPHDSRKVEGQGAISFVARDAGVHRLLFDNTYSLMTGKTVDVRWRVVGP